MRSIPSAILERSQSLAEGSVIAPKEFLHLGSRAAVDQAFCRLAKAGQLLRVARGIYAALVRTQKDQRAPSTESVVKSIGLQGKQAIAVSGAHAARVLGLTRARPIREIYLTSGRGKQLQIGDRDVTLLHAPYWMLSLGSTPAGDALRALAWMGEEQADRSTKALRRKLAKDQWEMLTSVRASLPSWMAAALGKASVRKAMR